MGFFDFFKSESKSTSTQSTSTQQYDYSASGSGAIGSGAVIGGTVSGVNLTGAGSSMVVTPYSQGVIDILGKSITAQKEATIAAQTAAASLAAGAQSESIATKTGGLSYWLPWIIGGVVALAGLFFIFGGKNKG